MICTRASNVREMITEVIFEASKFSTSLYGYRVFHLVHELASQVVPAGEEGELPGKSDIMKRRT